MGKEEKGSAREDKLKALDAALSQIEKQYGKGSVMKLGDTSHIGRLTHHSSPNSTKAL